MSRLDRLIALLGGEENLPEKLPEPAPYGETVKEEDEEQEQEGQPPPIIRDLNPQPLRYPQPLPQQKITLNPVHVMESEDDIPFDSGKGEPAPLGVEFATFGAVTKYCYKYVPRELMQPLATAYFDADKIYRRDWDLYYINAEGYGLLTFVKADQFQLLLDELNEGFPDAHLGITDEDRDGGLVVDFEDLPTRYRPRWLGHCTSRVRFNSWTHRLQQEVAMTLPTGEDRSLEAFKAKMELAYDAAKRKTKANKQRKHQETLLKRQDMVKQALRAEGYLGLRVKNDPNALLPSISGLNLTPLDVTNPPPHSCDREPIFIAIDVEAYERPPRHVTEVGIATLDTRDLKGTAPGKAATEWFKFIRGRHFLVLEHKHLVNHEFVQGCPDGFEFGESELVSKDSLGSVLSSCFREPFSKRDVAPPFSAEPATETRNLIIVGHDLGQDIAYCHQVGFSVLNRGNIIDNTDTLTMFRTFTKDPNARSLGSILDHFDLTGWHLHNAGNDAVYTMQSMLAIAVQSAVERGGEEQKRNEAQKKCEEQEIESAKERAKESAQGWEYSSSDDGGVAVPPTAADFAPRSKVGANRPIHGGGRSPRCQT
ncbi:hypothetical protein DOTSEDRAFT_58207 [Dothistroma septosporum NZE10]|uniref:Gfd2/YDR514C-like C-terminal domain-containing protein n=1 Tax=Dothistroma septosporum (strain NZE10 / CBS 128990) TaxID=675120 RepID=N1PZH4_DOTSN|nr:hypothetical protein DOTSEDRAFT_58207 [Dothistroma septosporum NZE10]